jgi:hypothetical protein
VAGELVAGLVWVLGVVFAAFKVYQVDKKVYSNRHLPYNEIDILSPMEETYQNNNLFYFPEAYERL